MATKKTTGAQPFDRDSDILSCVERATAITDLARVYVQEVVPENALPEINSSTFESALFAIEHELDRIRELADPAT